MFSSNRSAEPGHNKSFGRSHKTSKSNASFSSSSGVKKRRHESVVGGGGSFRRPAMELSSDDAPTIATTITPSSSPIVTIVVGSEQRIFAAHEDVLCSSPFFSAALRGAYGPGLPAGVLFRTSDSGGGGGKRIALPDEEPEIFSSVLEYLYRGDYYPRLVHNKRRNVWDIEQSQQQSQQAEAGGATAAAAVESTVYHRGVDGDLLKDTVIYCAAEKYGLEELKRVALKKQGLQSGIQCSTILSSARYAYANTPDTDSKLRAHYLALIIRSRRTFKRSGTMQLEMFNGGTQLFFDLFVALCNHVDDVSIQAAPSSSSRRY